jgi:solute carrier family 35 protein E3
MINIKENILIFLYLLINIISSFSIVLCNKYIINECKCNYILTITALHFIVNYLFHEILCLLKFSHFQRPSIENRISIKYQIILAILGTLSIISINLSLQYNSVFIYQIFKLLNIPCVILFQPYLLYTLSLESYLSLIGISIGVIISTVEQYDLKTNIIGIILSSVGVISTSIAQINSSSIQKELNLTPIQLNHCQSLPTSILCAIFAYAFEIHSNYYKLYNVLFLNNKILLLVLLTCLISLAVNISTYAILGKTSPLTFQVVGQIKTCCVLIGGWILFDHSVHIITFKTIFGIILAFISSLIYAYIKTYN